MGEEPHQTPGIQGLPRHLGLRLRLSAHYPQLTAAQRGPVKCAKGCYAANTAPERLPGPDAAAGPSAVPFKTPPRGLKPPQPRDHRSQLRGAIPVGACLEVSGDGVAAAGARTGHGPLWGLQLPGEPNSPQPRAPHARPTGPHLNPAVGAGIRRPVPGDYGTQGVLGAVDGSGAPTIRNRRHLALHIVRRTTRGNSDPGAPPPPKGRPQKPRQHHATCGLVFR
ncbi:hypothetical protein GWK47_011959 [Chionoecetes opilio]|uniref:Uncharacterized protein n=1 Tax=Chionoecetes opilio TaxID=41210 RepID=A0A8J5CMQ0_CHIOP|nr:hypothetical protein GWK47_011959 [Chionoecetes opilio]